MSSHENRRKRAQVLTGAPAVDTVRCASKNTQVVMIYESRSPELTACAHHLDLRRGRRQRDRSAEGARHAARAARRRRGARARRRRARVAARAAPVAARAAWAARTSRRRSSICSSSCSSSRRSSATIVSTCMSMIRRAPSPPARVPLVPQEGAEPSRQGGVQVGGGTVRISTTSHAIAAGFSASRASGRCPERLRQLPPRAVQRPRLLFGRLSDNLRAGVRWRPRANRWTDHDRAWRSINAKTLRIQRARSELLGRRRRRERLDPSKVA